jgi:hypothetical protein
LRPLSLAGLSNKHIHPLNECIKRLSEEASKLSLLGLEAEAGAARDEEVRYRLETYRRGEVKAYTWEEINERRARRERPVS